MIIGGHWGMEVHREDEVIYKRVTGGGEDPNGVIWNNRASLQREAEALQVMAGSKYAPILLDDQLSLLSLDRAPYGYYIVETDVGDAGSMDNEHAWRRDAIRMLWTIRERGLRHGDLTWANIITRGNQVWAVDWQEAHLLVEQPPEGARSTSDSALLFRYLRDFKSTTGQADMSRIARRWLVVLEALGADEHHTPGLPLKGKSFLDLGCFQGDFCGAAAAEGMRADGVDFGGFRSDENSIEIARAVWDGMPCTFHQQDIFTWPNFAYDVVMMFSTWPYLVQVAGGGAATDLLRQIIHECGTFFFETQLRGDGPGPEFLKTDKDVADLLSGFGSPKALGTFPVNGRDATRTVWMVSSAKSKED
jgi:predicted Ser/Thr protein kinase